MSSIILQDQGKIKLIAKVNVEVVDGGRSVPGGHRHVRDQERFSERRGGFLLPQTGRIRGPVKEQNHKGRVEEDVRAPWTPTCLLQLSLS